MDIAAEGNKPSSPSSVAVGGSDASPRACGGLTASENGAVFGAVTDTILVDNITQLKPQATLRGEKYASLTDYERKQKKKKGRYFHALVSGLAWHKKDDLRFLTLSSPVGAQPIQKSWNGLRAVIHKTTVGSLIDAGFLQSSAVPVFYPNRSLDTPIRFEYLCQVTSEGNGVLHIVMAGDFLPVKFIRHHWNRIHGGSAGYKGNVNFKIERIRTDGYGGIKKYLLSQYLSGQDKFMRFSCSAGWIFPGYRSLWLSMIRQYGFPDALLRWQYMMSDHIPPSTQSLLPDALARLGRRD